MKLRDYVLNSSKYAFRSNLFVWNRFDVSLGFYEEHKGELCFNGNDGNTMLIGQNVEIWFVMDDETIVFDDVYCLEKNEFWMWNRDRLCTGAVDNGGNLVFVKDGWMVRMYSEGEVIKLAKVPEGACNVSIQGNTIYLNRPYKDTEYTYLEAYDYQGCKNEQESAELLESSEPEILYWLKKEKIEVPLKEESDFTYKSVWDTITEVLVFHRETFLNASPDRFTIDKYHEKIADYIRYLFLKQHRQKYHSKAGDLLANKIIRGESDLHEYNYYSEYNYPPSDRLPIPETDGDFTETLEHHKQIVNTVLRIVKRLGKDCSLESFDSIMSNPDLMDNVFRFYMQIDLAQLAFKTEKF